MDKLRSIIEGCKRMETTANDKIVSNEDSIHKIELSNAFESGKLITIKEIKRLYHD